MKMKVENNLFTIEKAVDKPSAETIKSSFEGERILLASTSPRRKKVLELLGLDFDVYKPRIDETPPAGVLPSDYAEAMAVKKVKNALENDVNNRVIIGADTVVILGERILGKPADEAEAAKMLRSLRGKEHIVITAVAMNIKKAGKVIFSHESTRVLFKRFTDEHLYEYIDSGEPLDKAGSYGIQGMGSVLVEKINGELDNVIGFPLNCLAKMLLSQGYGR
ncbi:MAG: septum formation protein Maf [candidate division Zixibacteria bacterium]|nr:septum formation protein Maf [candidate division Zixibacteria bacterium]